MNLYYSSIIAICIPVVSSIGRASVKLLYSVCVDGTSRFQFAGFGIPSNINCYKLNCIEIINGSSFNTFLACYLISPKCGNVSFVKKDISALLSLKRSTSSSVRPSSCRCPVGVG